MIGRELHLARISPMSAFRVGLAMSLVGLVAWIIAVCLLYMGLDQAGIWDSLNSLVGSVGGGIEVSFGLVVSAAALFGAIIAVLMTILAPLMAVIYNAIVDARSGDSQKLSLVFCQRRVLPQARVYSECDTILRYQLYASSGRNHNAAYVGIECEAVRRCRDPAHHSIVQVYRLTTPRPRICLKVEIFQQELDEAFPDTLLLLFQ